MNLRMAGAAVALMVAGAASAQSAVQWRVEDGGNGHWYALIAQPRTWQAARDWCVSHGGHLATPNSFEENAFVTATTGSPHAWLGGFQDLLSPDFSEPAGGWIWVTAEPRSFSAWNAGEPNNYPPGLEVSLATVHGTQRWADLPEDWTLHFHIEFDADCNSDGIVDFGQIRDGSLADANANNIPDCCENGTVCGCPADIVQDGAVNGVDLAAVINAWGTNGGKLPRADTNRDGIVDGVDLANVLGSWGPCP